MNFRLRAAEFVGIWKLTCSESNIKTTFTVTTDELIELKNVISKKVF